MTRQEFDDALRPFWWSEPFRPFIVETGDGRIIEVNHPTFVFCNGGATYIAPDGESMEQFYYHNVRAIRAAQPEVTA